MAGGMFEMKINIDRHGPRLLHNILNHLTSRYQLTVKQYKDTFENEPYRLSGKLAWLFCLAYLPI